MRFPDGFLPPGLEAKGFFLVRMDMGNEREGLKTFQGFLNDLLHTGRRSFLQQG